MKQMKKVNLLGGYPNPKNKRYVDDDLRTIIEKCENYMDAKGFLPRNPNRKTTGDRQFLTAEKQLWGHLGLMKENKKINLLSFNNEKIGKLIEEFYEHYETVYKL